ncbi:ABC transporter ATP-binding protein [Paenibacillus sp. ISL-20]|uniref:ABC transporter ATP-binding protein n=1 Tax=Paenibacillus sp. ISL-20 TaxID=2819163 RepID=UPI001BE6BB81|nr:ABC transporter ATP-binding protein [Paenibacillus sp. ISL-20]MBT2762684.1 ABC transporter ATP-binding protein [Paenibacillus sp. ISL-20]
MNQSKKKEKNGYNFLKLLLSTKPPLTLIIIAILVSAISTVAGLFIPLYTKELIDIVSIKNLDLEQLGKIGIVFILQTITSGVSIYLLNKLGEQILSSLRKKLLEKLLFLPVSYYDNNKTGETISRVISDTSIIKSLISEHMSNFLTGMISVAGSIIILLYLDFKMTLVILSTIPLISLILLPLNNKIFKISKALQAETAQFTTKLTQVLSEIRTVKSCNAEKKELEEGVKSIRKLFNFGLRESKIQALIVPIMFFIMMLILMSILAYGGLRVSSGTMSAGELIAFIMYLLQLLFPINQIVGFLTKFQKANGASERLITMLQTKEEDHLAGSELQYSNSPININNVSFHHNAGEPVLKDINIHIKEGSVTAFVGPSGAGKTTLFSIIERYYEPTNGTIWFGPTTINSFTIESWRKQIGYVSQESPLIDGSIRHNICYGLERPVTDDELSAVTKMSFAEEFINKLPDGFDTEVGERGVKLSGGQRQRIAISRALLRNPGILMLDEATSSLDSKTEAIVQEALKNLMKGRTTLVIAHRLSTVIDADNIIFIENGVITGSGTHSELFSKHSLYREFATQQLQET